MGFCEFSVEACSEGSFLAPSIRPVPVHLQNDAREVQCRQMPLLFHPKLMLSPVWFTSGAQAALLFKNGIYRLSSLSDHLFH